MIRKLIIYIIIFTGCFLISDLILVYFTNKSLNQSAFVIPSDKNVLILGNSSLECAINDSIVSNGINLSNSGEAYIYTYLKMKLFLEANSQIDVVLLSFNYNSLLAHTEYQVLDHNGIQNIDRYCPFFKEDELSVFKKSFYYYRGIMKLPYTYRKVFFKSNQATYEDLSWGGYLHLDKNKLEENIQRYGNIMKQMKVTQKDYNNVSFQAYYLHKIISYCKQSGVTIILVNSPVYMDYQYGVEEYYRYYNTNYPDIPLWDYSALDLPDSFYADIYHLNYKGARVFSELIKKRLSEQKNQQNKLVD